MSTRHVAARLAAAVLATAAATLGLVATGSGPADAAGCSGSRGVTVVVDHGTLGGGVTQACSSSGGGKSGLTQFTSTGFSLTYVQRQPGFVCRIDGEPASDPCVNTPPGDAYWGLWWSDGKSGSWSYSSVAAGSLKIPDGGYVAFAWQSGAKSAPAVSPTPHASAPTPSAAPTTAPTSAAPTKKPSTKPSSHPSSAPSKTPSSHPSATTAGSPPAPTATPSAAPEPGTATPGATDSPASATTVPSASDPAPSTPAEPMSGAVSESPSEAGTTSGPASAVPTEGPVAGASGSAQALPVWVVPLVLLVLAAGGATYLLRRRSRAP